MSDGRDSLTARMEELCERADSIPLSSSVKARDDLLRDLAAHCRELDAERCALATAVTAAIEDCEAVERRYRKAKDAIRHLRMCWAGCNLHRERLVIALGEEGARADTAEARLAVFVSGEAHAALERAAAETVLEAGRRRDAAEKRLAETEAQLEYDRSAGAEVWMAQRDEYKRRLAEVEAELARATLEKPRDG